MTGRVFGVCGASGSGKTTLLKALIREFSSMGMRVGVVKHHGHGGGLELPEQMRRKDSHQLFAAGAHCAAVSFAGGVWMEAVDEDLGEILFRYMLWADIVLLEGFKGADVKKIEVVAPGREPIVAPGGEVVALAARGGRGRWMGLEVVDADRPGDVARFILSQLGREEEARVVVGGRVLEGPEARVVARVVEAVAGIRPREIEVRGG